MRFIIPDDFPIIVCICGSTRFVEQHNEWKKFLTLKGYIVVGIELVVSQTHQQDPQHNDYHTKKLLDELHLRKIDLSDEVLFLNVGGYMGESTHRELAYAIEQNKVIKFLEPRPK